jgi:hypothetical protein
VPSLATTVRIVTEARAVSEPELLPGEWPTADAVVSRGAPVTDGEELDPANRATYDRENVTATLKAARDYLDDSGRAYLRSRDLEADAEADPRTIGGVLALVADVPEVLESEYDIELSISVSRWGQQPAGTVWEVTSRD